MKTTTTDESRYIYSRDNVIAEYDGSSNLKYNYIYGNGQKLARVDANGTKEYFHNDYLGSVRRITYNSSSVVWSREYRSAAPARLSHSGGEIPPAGNTKCRDYPFGASRIASGSDEMNKYTYEGREKDLETDLGNNWKRLFNYEGRFTQVDPLWQKYPSMSSYVRVASTVIMCHQG